MAVSYNGFAVPANGARISYSNGRYQVPDNPIIPFIEGDGTGRDIWKASVRVFDAAVQKAYTASAGWRGTRCSRARRRRPSSRIGCPMTP